jgi:hypothetical protein
MARGRAIARSAHVRALTKTNRAVKANRIASRQLKGAQRAHIRGLMATSARPAVRARALRGARGLRGRGIRGLRAGLW